MYFCISFRCTLSEIQKYIVNQAFSQSIHNHTAATITQHTSVHFTIAASLLSAHFGTTIATQQHHWAHRRSQLRSRQGRVQSAQRTGGSRTRQLVQALAAGACCVPGGGCHHHHMYLVYPCRSGPSSHLVQHSPAAAAWMAAVVAQLAQLAGLMLGHAGSCPAHAAALAEACLAVALPGRPSCPVVVGLAAPRHAHPCRAALVPSAAEDV